jgi:Fe-S-cluster-containing dehydrogenase component
MDLSRRQALGVLAKGGVPLLATSTIGAALSTPVCAAVQSAIPIPLPGAVAMLYDTSICTGCKACVSACAEANGLVPDTRLDGLHQSPLDLNAFTKNIIKLYDPVSGPHSYVKQQCMHCLEPACVSACPFEALFKRGDDGIVAWEPTKCIGCRYCEVACPYHVPKFEWAAQNPAIVKCEFCQHRLAVGEEPACTAVCPTKAVVYGPRSVLLDAAKERIKDTPGRYFENRVYGEHEAGGTQVLYLSHVPFESIGLPTLSADERPGRYLFWQSQIYKFFALPAFLYAFAVKRMRQNFVEHQRELRDEHRQSGVDPQL